MRVACGGGCRIRRDFLGLRFEGGVSVKNFGVYVLVVASFYFRKLIVVVSDGICDFGF